MKIPLRDTYFVAKDNSRSSRKLKIMDYITYTLLDVLLCSIAKNFFKIYGECVTKECKAERNWRGKFSSVPDWSTAGEFSWFRPTHHWRNLFHFSQWEKNRLLIVQITHLLKFFVKRKRRVTFNCTLQRSAVG